jgi:uncharacterized protein (UPF0332 family)
MIKIKYDYKKKKRASTLLALGVSEQEAACALIEKELFREALFHLYFASFYISQALLVEHLRPNPSHKNVETQLNRIYGKKKGFPNRYVRLHGQLHNLRNDYNYKILHTPSPSMIQAKFKALDLYVKFALKVTPRVEAIEIIKDICEDNIDIVKDISYDIYCPKTYTHHNRITFWQPPFYLDIFSPKKLAVHAGKLLKSLRVKKHNDYVLGINSRVNQYTSSQILMLDIDSFDTEIESVLASIGGILLKSGRGFHFIGDKLIVDDKAWRKLLRSLSRDKVLKRYIDHKHIDISLARGYSTLRITDSPIKPNIPFFFKAL